MISLIFALFHVHLFLNSIDTVDNALKNMEMNEVVLKLERNLDTKVTSLTCKYKVSICFLECLTYTSKGLDGQIVAGFPVKGDILTFLFSKN